MNSQKGWTRTTKEIIRNGSLVKPMERTTSRSSNTKCGKYRPTDDALKYSFIFKNRNKHKEQREERSYNTKDRCNENKSSYANLANYNLNSQK